MASVPVVYVGNDDVGNLIKTVGPKKKRGIIKKSANELAASFATSESVVPVKKSSKKNKSKNVEETTEEEKIPSFNGSEELCSDDRLKSSMQVYSFKTPKRSKQMTKYAAESALKSRMRKVNEIADTTENSSASHQQEDDGNVIEKQNYSLQHHLRGNTNSNTTESDSSDQENSDQSDSEDFIARAPAVKAKSSTTVPSTSYMPSHRLQLPSERELYFDSHGGSKTGGSHATKTSDRTLDRLKNPRMAPDQLSRVLQKHKNESKKVDGMEAVEECQSKLYRSYELQFTKWMFYLCNNFNLLLFGLGSKRKLLHSFCDGMLKKQNKIVVNGFFPSLSIKSILASICEDIMKLTTGFSNVETQFESVCEYYGTNSKSSDHLFLIIHNIDGVMLRNSKSQAILSKLADLPRIHILASIDHINAALIWDQTKLSRFHWLWYDVTTYSPYVEETSYEGSLLLTGAGAGVGSRGAALALSGLMHVARSLTSNARGVFRILAEHHLEDKEDRSDDKGNEDFSFSDLYQKCRERFLVNSELTLRAHLTEFLDHKLVQIRKGLDGGECLSVPLDTATLKEYLEQDEAS